MEFSTLGEGVVNYKTVFQTLNNADFYGPFTMELEGIEGENLDEAGVKARVADSPAAPKRHRSHLMDTNLCIIRLGEGETGR